MRRIAKIDRNQPEIIETYRDSYCSAQPTHTIGGGFVDAVVGVPGFTIVTREDIDLRILQYLLEKIGVKEYAIHQGGNLCIEIKDGQKPPSARKLTPDEQEWHETWRGQKCVVASEIEALRSIGLK